MVLSDKTLRLIKPVDPFVEQEVWIQDCHLNHTPIRMTYGLGPCGYDIRIDEGCFVGSCEGDYSSHCPAEEKRIYCTLKCGMTIASSMEKFNMPNDVMGVVHDKSSWARRGLSVFNTVIEPGWRGFLTLELKNMSDRMIYIPRGAPIAQVVFHRLDQECEKPYNGKYQDQERGPQNAR